MTKVFEKLSRIEFVFGEGLTSDGFVKSKTWCPLGTHQLGKHHISVERKWTSKKKLNRRAIQVLCVSICMSGFILFVDHNFVSEEDINEQTDHNALFYLLLRASLVLSIFL